MLALLPPALTRPCPGARSRLNHATPRCVRATAGSVVAAAPPQPATGGGQTSPPAAATQPSALHSDGHHDGNVEHQEFEVRLQLLAAWREQYYECLVPRRVSTPRDESDCAIWCPRMRATAPFGAHG